MQMNKYQRAAFERPIRLSPPAGGTPAEEWRLCTAHCDIRATAHAKRRTSSATPQCRAGSEGVPTEAAGTRATKLRAWGKTKHEVAAQLHDEGFRTGDQRALVVRRRPSGTDRAGKARPGWDGAKGKSPNAPWKHDHEARRGERARAAAGAAARLGR